MIGIIVVTHGTLAGELVNAARTIVGDIPAIAAVSIGWSDDMTMAHEGIERAIADVGGGDVLILTDMFGGTPTNVSLPFLSPRGSESAAAVKGTPPWPSEAAPAGDSGGADEPSPEPPPRVEIVTGVNLPMLIKLTTQREGDLLEIARAVRDQGKDAIYVASEILEKKRA